MAENKELRRHVANHKIATVSLQNTLAESKADRAQLKQLLEESKATIFHLRPRGKEHTESEIEGDYRSLLESIKSWIETNCGEFLDDEVHGFEIMETDNKTKNANPEPFEIILARFQTKSQYDFMLKEHILAAVVMRYLFDRVLNQHWPLTLREEDQKLLDAVYNRMTKMDPPKGKFAHLLRISLSLTVLMISIDLITVRMWKSDTVTAIESDMALNHQYSAIEKSLTRNLYIFLKAVLQSGNSPVDSMSSLHEEIIVPATILARKVCIHNFSSFQLVPYFSS